MKEVVLKNKQEFEKILASYAISEHGKKILHDVEYVMLIGPAAAGRNTIINELVRGGTYHQVISDTTRPPKLRDGQMEQDGVNYFFRSEEELLQDLKDGEFLEAELIHNQQVSGTSIRELEAAVTEGKVAINEVEYGGAMNVLEAKPDSKVYAIFPPSFDEWYSRFSSREDIHVQELINRLHTLQKVIATVQNDERIIVIINDDYQLAASTLDSYVHGSTPDQESVLRTKALLEEYSQRTSTLLEELHT